MAKEQDVHLPDDLGQEPETGKKRRILKLLVGLFLLAALVVLGFFLGIYLRIFDTNSMNEKLGLYDMPVIGQFFVKPAPKTTDTTDDSTTNPKSKIEDSKPDANAQTSKPVVLTKAEIEKQMKAKQAEEKKRVSKLARLYNEMKPAEAASVMDALDDDVAVAILQRMDESQAGKILAKFDPDKSARLTKLMYVGTTKKMQSPADADVQNGQGDANGQNGQNGQGGQTQANP